MHLSSKAFCVTIWIILMSVGQSLELEPAEIEEAEKNLEDGVDLVLSDLNAEIAAKNRTFIAEKIAQIRARKTKFPARSEIVTDVISAKLEKRLKRKRMKKKCVALAQKFQGSRKQVRRKVW